MGNVCTASSKKSQKEAAEIVVSSNSNKNNDIEIDVVPVDIPKDLIQRTLRKVDSSVDDIQDSNSPMMDIVI